jgi:hypothetical protein
LAGVSSPVAASSNIHVPKARIMFCVLATNDDPRAKPDATYDRDHWALLERSSIFGEARQAAPT